MDFIEDWARARGRYDELIRDLGRLVPGGATDGAGAGALLQAVRAAARRLKPTWFYDLYRIVQRATRPEPGEGGAALARYYREGFDAVIRARQNEELDELRLFVSAGFSLEVLDVKLAALAGAVAHRPSPRVALRLTLPRTSTLGPAETGDVVGELLRRMAIGATYYESVVGLDISGDERGTPWARTLAVLRELVAFRPDAPQPLSVSIHLGEDLSGTGATELLSRFRSVLAADVDAIGHGVFLWAAEDRLRAHHSTQHLAGRAAHRAGLLAEVRARGIALEICPTTTLLSQPALDFDDLPTRLPAEVRPTIVLGTDNPVLFGTTLVEERRLAGELTLGEQRTAASP